MGALKPGYQITSELVLGRRLGAGGMGTVWIAQHKKLQTEVVVKFLSESLTADPEACQRFSREVTATVQVRSPHVVQLFDHGVTESGIPYIVMELLEGDDLSKTLRKRGHLPADEVMHILEGVGSALQKVHEKGIVHRDVKPANVFLCSGTPRPFVKLVDFGIAKRLEDETMTATNALIGTPAYMSPEQMNSSPWMDHRTDLWALGVLAFHMLTGAPPFRGSHVANIVHAMMSEPTPKVTTTRPELPPHVDVWMTRALALDPTQRFASAREMLHAFEIALGDLAYATTRRMEGSGSGSGAANIVVVQQTPSHPSGVAIVGGQPPPPALPSSPSFGAPGSHPSGALALDGVGATLGPSAVTHSPHGTMGLGSSKVKWFVLGGVALLVVVMAAAFRVGYVMHREDVATGSSSSTSTALAGTPNVALTTTTTTTMTPSPSTSVAPTTTVASTTAPTTTTSSARTAPNGSRTTRKPRPGGRPADDDDIGF